MRASRVTAVVLRQYYLIRGSAARLVPLFAWIAVDMVLWGFMTRYLNTVSSPGINFVALLLGPVLVWDFFSRVMQGVTMAFFEDVWTRNFLNIFATPLSIYEYLAGLVVSSIVTSSVGLAVMLLIATVVFGLSFLSYGIALGPFMLVLFVTGIALGIVGSSIVLRLGPAAEWFIWPIPAILAPFACVFYPLSTLPRWMQFISAAIPPSYVFEGMRTIVRGGAPRASLLAFGAVLAFVYLMLAVLFFAITYRRAVRTGLIARFTAETVT